VDARKLKENTMLGFKVRVCRI